MIVLNAFLKGLAEALGAVLCYALFVVYKHNVSLWKRFWSFVKKRRIGQIAGFLKPTFSL